MNNTVKIILAIAVVAIIAILALKTGPKAPVPPDSNDGSVATITGCYVAHLGNDVYSLNITSQTGESFSGTLSFKNYQKDSSSGTYVGTYKDGILLGDYSFKSEGTDSVMQVIFKRQGSDFVRGYGPLDATGTRFTDLNAITYDQSQVFKATSDGCTSTSTSTQGGIIVTPVPNGPNNPFGIIKVGETKTINGITITVNKITMDNRCPTDVTCIVAGSVVANVTLKSGTSASTLSMSSEGAQHTFAGRKISIANVVPKPVSTQTINGQDYQITFEVEK